MYFSNFENSLFIILYTKYISIYVVSIIINISEKHYELLLKVKESVVICELKIYKMKTENM